MLKTGRMLRQPRAGDDRDRTAIAPSGPGLRERNKRDKLARIVAAATVAFSEKGFERTTMREIAEAAGIGSGTLFLYAPTKEDLLAMVFRAELEPVIEASFGSIPPADLLTQILHTFSGVIDHHGRNMVLSRPFLKDLAFVGARHASDAAALNARHVGGIAELIDQAKARGEIYGEADSQLAAGCSHQLFVSNLRRWVAGRTTREQFEDRLAAALRLLLTGLGPDYELKPRGT